MKRILITGGAGFLGSHLTERLLDEGNQVYVLDNFCTGRRENIAKFFNNKNFTLIRQDVTDAFDLDVDEIYNLA